jgi:purine-binding chemotaxis protein CheW
MPDQVELLVFELGDQQFGVATTGVEEIARAVSCARLPKAPPIVEGVLNFRGTAVPVLDIRSRFGLAAKPVDASDHLVIARAGHRMVAIRVDRAVSVISVPGENLESMDGITAHSEYIAGVAKLPGNIIFIHELATFLSAAEAAAIDSSIAQAPA